MKYITTFILILFLVACSKDPVCKTCATVTYSDEFKQLGLANNGFDEKDRIELGYLCDEKLDAAESISTVETQITSIDGSGNSYTYTVRVITECD